MLLDFFYLTALAIMGTLAFLYGVGAIITYGEVQHDRHACEVDGGTWHPNKILLILSDGACVDVQQPG